MSWKNKNSYTLIKNIAFFSTSTAKYYIPMGSTSTEKTSIDEPDAAIFTPSSGRITRIILKSDVSPGSSILTIEDRDNGILGTKVFTFNVGFNSSIIIDLNSELDSGTNFFDGLSGVGIGLDVTSTADNVQALITFEVDL